MPLPVIGGRTTQVFGPTNEKLDSGGFNKGWDVGIPVGSAVYAVAPGNVIAVGDQGDGWGISVKVRDAQGFVHNYGHLNDYTYHPGDWVEAGDPVGTSGNTGASTGPHLSYDVRSPDGRYVDPSPWLGFNAAGDNRVGVNPYAHQTSAPVGGRARTQENTRMSGPMQYSSNVERWRPLVSRYFKPEDVDKALWVIQHESSGNPAALGDGIHSVGLFQLNDGGVGSGLSLEQRADPETNIRAAASAVYGGQGWKPWGEGNTNNGQPFGALGNHPYPGSSGGSGMPDPRAVVGNIFSSLFGTARPTAGGSSAGASASPSQVAKVMRDFGVDEDTARKIVVSLAGGDVRAIWPEVDANKVDHFFDTRPIEAAQLGLSRDQFDFSKTKWGQEYAQELARFGLDQDIFGFTQDKFAAEHGLDREKFNFDMGSWGAEFGLKDKVATHGINEDVWRRGYDTSRLKWQQAMDERDFALKLGDFELAQQKQADANYWEGISAGFEQQRINLQNQGQQLDYSAAMARVAADKYASDNAKQVGLANATNDAERNQIEARWKAEQAAIAKMEDETRRILGGQQNQTGQFDAETRRAVGMGGLALEKNKFIAELARSPRDFPTLWFMQRGVAPDWDTMAAGGTPARGDALAPSDVMRAFIPTTAAPTFNGTPGNSAAGAVGQAMGSYSPGANPFLSAGMAGGGAANETPVPTPAVLPYQAPQAYGPPPRDPIQIQYDRNPAGRGGGVPIAALKPGMNLSTVGGDTLGSDFTMPAYYDEYKTRPIGPGDKILGGTQVWVDYQTGAGAAPAPSAPPATDPARMTYRYPIPGLSRDPVPAFAEGGFTRAPLFIVGDRVDGQPSGTEEIVHNPTGAPLQVAPNRAQSLMRYFAPGAARDTGAAQDVRLAPLSGYFNPVQAPDQQQIEHARRVYADYLARRPQLPAYLHADKAGPTSDNLPAPAPRPTLAADYWGQQGARGAGGAWRRYQQEAVARRASAPAPHPAPAPMAPPVLNTSPVEQAVTPLPAPINADGDIPRFALGTGNVQAQYSAQGMGSAYLPESSNPHLTGMDLPLRLRMLADYGMPISPALAAATTGRTAPMLNVGSAVTQGRQSGVLPSLQTLGRQTKSETEATRGYYEGVGGTSWSDIIDWLGKPTGHLKTAAAARGV